jgi:hypothetical protein
VIVTLSSGEAGGGYKGHKYFRHMRNCARIRDLYRQRRARRHQLALAGVMWAMQHDTVSSLPDKRRLEGIPSARWR